MDDDRTGLPTAEQFQALCRRHVPLILAALQGSILADYVHKAVAAEHMPMWAKQMLLGIYPPVARATNRELPGYDQVSLFGTGR